jgi:hypothetical protein
MLQSVSIWGLQLVLPPLPLFLPRVFGLTFLLSCSVLLFFAVYFATASVRALIYADIASNWVFVAWVLATWSLLAAAVLTI